MNCKHTKRKPYLDNTIICRECGCILAQNGIAFDRPVRLWRAKKQDVIINKLTE